MEEELEKQCEFLRKGIKDVGTCVQGLMWHSDFGGEEAFPRQHAEMKANIMLSFRHLEDARMRLGKVMQQMQGGVSKFDRPPVEVEPKPENV